MRRGCAGVWVSNHGGRQLDGGPGTAEALPGVAAAVAGRVPAALDSLLEFRSFSQEVSDERSTHKILENFKFHDVYELQRFSHFFFSFHKNAIV